MNELLHRALAQLLRTELELPADVIVTIVAADTSADLQNATVWVSVLPEAAAERTVAHLARSARMLHAALFRTVRFRPVPQLHFRRDTNEARAADVEKLLDQLPKPGV